MHLPVLPPPFNEEERERLKRQITEVDNILNPALDGFIVGTVSLDEFDSVMQQAIDAGSEEIPGDLQRRGGAPALVADILHCSSSGRAPAGGNRRPSRPLIASPSQTVCV